ncbi:CHASE2 domain-containing protein [Kerstersia gyiorum]|nr:CHASE2 domain-containing protein [Kerstersia gyiorum]QBR40220.1 CHASE2 domain-containing protein [Kerstersia gyiorum]
MPERAPRFSRRALPGWGLALFLSLLLGGLSLLNGLGRIDYLIYDNLLRTIEHDASPEIVLIAIDDGSLEQLGNWPWPRTTHAQLLDRIAGASAVAFDVIFSEADRYGGLEDTQLAVAMRRHGHVVLPGILDARSGQIIPPPKSWRMLPPASATSTCSPIPTGWHAASCRVAWMTPPTWQTCC